MMKNVRKYEIVCILKNAKINVEMSNNLSSSIEEYVYTDEWNDDEGNYDEYKHETTITNSNNNNNNNYMSYNNDIETLNMEELKKLYMNQEISDILCIEKALIIINSSNYIEYYYDYFWISHIFNKVKDYKNSIKYGTFF